MKKLTLLSSVLLLAPVLAIAGDVETRIINGTNTSSEYFPSIASLVYDDGNDILVYCGATIIDNYHVLTAAHCVYDNTELTNATYVAPNLDSKYEYQTGVSRKVKAVNIYYPSDYRDSAVLAWPNDVAIVEVAEPLNVSSSQYVQRASYNQQLQYMDPDINHYAVGHGLVDNSNSIQDQLQVTTLNVVSDSLDGESCEDYIPTQDRICTTGSLSTSTNLFNSTCSGDSGGPLYWEDGADLIQIGITSFGPEICGDSDYIFSSVFTEVAAHNDWIDEVLADRVSPKIVVDSTPFDFGSSGGTLGLGTLLLGLFLVAIRFNK